ncbi:MAG: hypothetical protein JSW39_00320 [Desulfobacterales bacterium]|nr:MAG: hypothetical protein JSW39_00320 [Desulfobacterales bacterium]
MKEKIFKKMESMFPFIEHDYHELGPLEMTIVQLARGNTFNMRVVGLEGIKRFREDHPDCAVTFKPNHLSEADFIILSILFRENNMRVLTEGGSNLFIDDIDIFKDLLPEFVNPMFAELSGNHGISIAQYLKSRGAFKVFRKPIAIRQDEEDGIKLGKKDILSLSRAYRYHLVEEREMYVTFPGYSTVKSGLLELLKKNETKTGRSYTGQIDGFHHLPFLMDLEASFHTGAEIYVVAVNIAYEPVLEDVNFMELVKLQDSGVEPERIYRQDLGYIMREFTRDKKKGNLSIKFGQPSRMQPPDPKDTLAGLKIKNAAHKLAADIYTEVLSMQPVFPANIYFTAFDEKFNRIPVPTMKKKIDDLKDHLRTLLWGKDKSGVDLHYVLGYNGHIFSADEIINRTLENFNTPHRRITDLDGDIFVVYNKDVAQQYKNHTAHFFKDFKPA